MDPDMAISTEIDRREGDLRILKKVRDDGFMIWWIVSNGAVAIQLVLMPYPDPHEGRYWMPDGLPDFGVHYNPALVGRINTKECEVIDGGKCVFECNGVTGVDMWNDVQSEIAGTHHDRDECVFRVLRRRFEEYAR